MKPAAPAPPLLGMTTNEALDAAGLSLLRWGDMLNRGRYSEAAPSGKGRIRRHDADDMVTMAVMAQLIDMRLGTAFAAHIGNIVRRQLRLETVPDVLYLVPPARDKAEPRLVTQPRPDRAVCLEIRIKGLRATFSQRLRDHAEAASQPVK